jgi:hypothetical protein
LVERLVPEQPSSDAAMEGTCAAWLAEQYLTGAIEKCSDLVETVCPENNWPIDHIMVNHIQRYCDMIIGRGGDIKAERRVYLNEFINGTPDAYATIVEGKRLPCPDGKDGCLVNHHIKTTLYVDDLKYGFGIVDPTSKQVTIYAASIAWAMYHQGHAPDVIQIGIYQPRGYHVDGIYRTRKISFQQLTDEANQIIEDGKKCFDPNAITTPGRWCKYCPAAGVCGALTTELYDVYSMLQGKANRNATLQELSAELVFLDLVSDLLKGRKTAIEAVANARIDAGENIPGWSREPGRNGTRRWTSKVETIKAVTGIDPTSGKMVTVKEMENRGVDPSALAFLCEQPKTKSKLVQITAEDIKRRMEGS